MKTEKHIGNEIDRLYKEIEALDAKYHFTEDDKDVDENILDMISKKINRLQMLQNTIIK